MGRRARRLCAAATLLAALTTAGSAAAGSLEDVFRDPRFARLGLAPLGPALARTVASTYPVASASSSVVYVYDPELDTLTRRAGTLGPILGERAETLGQGAFDLAVTYSYVDLATINGQALDRLVNRRLIDGRFLFFPVPDGVTLKDGRVTTLLPVEVDLDLDVRAHMVAPSLTYGLTPDLDVNLVVPILHTSLDVTARTRAPDPRFPAFMLAPGDPNATTDVREAGAASTGVGDVLLRAKYVAQRGPILDLALGLGLSLPSGRREDFQGTGTTRVRPGLIASRRAFGEHVELLLNAGMDLDADDVERSSVLWAAGALVAPLESVTLPVVFLGRHELAAPTSPIALPWFFQIERSDVVDMSLGLRWQVTGSVVVAANALVPLTRDGLRANVVPTGSVEWVF